ncbi:MAG: ABC transporter ATP-binding protein [Burkholderiaceae bacterium]|nr:ABC transporter ATP-binding protein [Burkholderiaceae bacterium]
MSSSCIAALRGVGKRYVTPDGPVKVLEGIDLEVGYRDYVSLMGPSGSGKSTLLNILGGIDAPSEGEAWIDGERIDRLGEHKLLAIRRRKVAYVFQEARLLPSLTALENVLLPSAFVGDARGGSAERAKLLLERVGLGRRARHMAHQLSGGEAQRVCIARALLNQPMLILADEPTGNLDRRTRLEIVELFESLNREGNTIVMVTHDPELAERSGRRLVIQEGRIREAALH